MDSLKDTSYNLSNYFGFNENEVNMSLWEGSSLMNETSEGVQFQPNKPYRLALYVRPMEHKRLQRTKVGNTTKNPAQEKQYRTKNETVNNAHVSERKEVKRSTRINKKVNVMLFDENVKPESKNIKDTPEKLNSKKSALVEVPSARKNILKEVNTKSLTKTKQNKMRRSYERKMKIKEEAENIQEPPSEHIIQELELKKLTQTKPKKTKREEQEFEKWANNMNSAFDDVDKFELSIAYD